MPRIDPMDLWFAFMYRRWQTSADVLKMTLPEKGIFVDILAALAGNGGKLPRDPATLRLMMNHQDQRPIQKWLDNWKHLTACSQCGDSEVAVRSQCTHSEFTIPKFLEFQEKLRKSRVQDVPNERKEEKIERKQAKQAQKPDCKSNTPAPCPWCNSTPCKYPAVCANRAARAQHPDSPAPDRSGKPSASVSGDPLRDWQEDVGGVPAARIRLCVRWKLDLDADDTWYRDKISTAALRRPGFVTKLDSECPADAVIEKEIKAKVKTKVVWDEQCPNHCDRGKITFTPEGERWPMTRHCECLKLVEA